MQHAVALSPGFANEKKVDHLTIILEVCHSFLMLVERSHSLVQLYTKAYELFKKYNPVAPNNPTQGRLTLWIAYRIAQTYYDSGTFDMAVRYVPTAR